MQCRTFDEVHAIELLKRYSYERMQLRQGRVPKLRSRRGRNDHEAKSDRYEGGLNRCIDVEKVLRQMSESEVGVLLTQYGNGFGIEQVAEMNHYSVRKAGYYHREILRRFADKACRAGLI
jgi:hypothetical protein